MAGVKSSKPVEGENVGNTVGTIVGIPPRIPHFPVRYSQEEQSTMTPTRYSQLITITNQQQRATGAIRSQATNRGRPS
eukprot:scaffold50_cov162-Ochromonas_danica.AAC.29